MRFKIKRYRLYGAEIGEKVRAFSPVSSAESYMITVDDNTTISTGVKFITHDNSIAKISSKGTDLIGAIRIGKNCFIGMNAVILPGVSIADNCIVGAGSVVTKSITEKGTIVAGNPAKTVGSVKDFKKKYEQCVFDFKGQRPEDKKELIINNKDKWIVK